MYKKAIYPGSFDPFTAGHLDIVKKASVLFDEVCILIASNPDKKRWSNAEEMKFDIKNQLEYDGLYNVSVEVYDGLVSRYAELHNINYMVRGLRNNMDYDYEERIALVNKELNPSLETVYLRADNATISSSMIRELVTHSVDVSKYLPNCIRF